MLPRSRLPRARDPMTKSQRPERIGSTRAVMLRGSSAPSPSMNTTMSASSAAMVALRPCPPLAAPAFDAVRPRGFGPRRGGVATAAVRHDDAGYDRTRDAAHHIRDRLLLIERRYHDDDATGRSFAHATM